MTELESQMKLFMFMTTLAVVAMVSMCLIIITKWTIEYLEHYHKQKQKEKKHNETN